MWEAAFAWHACDRTYTATTVTSARKIQIADIAFGTAAGTALVVGFLRVLYFEKGAFCYFHTWTFLAKLTLFVVISLASIVPTLEFLSWRSAVKQDQVPSVDARKLQSLGLII